LLVAKTDQNSAFFRIVEIIDFDLAKVEIMDHSKVRDGAIVRFNGAFYFITSEENTLSFEIEMKRVETIRDDDLIIVDVIVRLSK